MHITGWTCPYCGPLTGEQVSLYHPERAFFNTMVRTLDPTCCRCNAPVSFDAATDGLGDPGGHVLVISGTCASGKTTISDVLAQQYGFVQLDGDWPPSKRKAEKGTSIGFNEAHNELLALAEGIVHLSHDVVIAHVVLPEWVPHYERYLVERGISHRIVILMPRMDVILDRNETRECWWTERGIIERFHDALLAGDGHVQGLFYDNGEETAEETANRLATLSATVPSPAT